MTHSPASGSRQGLAAAVGVYLLWGFLPLYFPLLGPASPLDISAHRVVWSWLVCLLLLAITSRFGEYTALLRNRRRMSRLALAAVLLSANWLIFLIGVLTGRVVEAALGYFMTPLMTVLLAVLVLRERINRSQWRGLVIAAAGLGVLTYENGRVILSRSTRTARRTEM